MSYVTVEVGIEHGKVVVKEPSQLPESGQGLLTILPAIGPATAPTTFLQALESLQQHLHLDDKLAANWMASVRDARR